MKSPNEKAWVAAGAVAAFLIRFLPALRPRYWLDEVYTIAVSAYPFSRIAEVTALDVHPPFYYWLIHGLMETARAVGEPLEHLAWLRLGSLLPGWALCLIAWAMARRFWGPRPALYALWAAAFSPALVYYSIELRNYALLQFLLPAAAGCMFLAITQQGARAWTATAGFSALMLLGLYTHSLSMLYGAVMLALFAGALAVGRGRRPQLLARACAAALIIGLGYLPWLPIALEQRNNFGNDVLDWLPFAKFPDLLTSFFFYLPFGPKTWPGAPGFAKLIALCGLILFLALAVWVLKTKSDRRRLAKNSDRLFIYALTLATLPLLLAFFVSHFEIAKIFLGSRYNLIAAPFWTLAAVRFFDAVRPVALRRTLLFGFIALGAAISLAQSLNRSLDNGDFDCLAAVVEDPEFRRQKRLYLTEDRLLPWIERCGEYRVASFREAFSQAETLDRPLWLGTHWMVQAGSHTSQWTTEFLKRELDKTAGADAIDVGGCMAWPDVWRVEPDALKDVAEKFDELQNWIESKRTAAAPGQVLLPIDERFRLHNGWANLEFDANRKPFCWTLGEKQRIAWSGPQKPGTYRLRVIFYRPLPFPEPEIEIRHRIDGGLWQTLGAGTGSVVVESAVEVRRAGQRLAWEMEAPTYIPKEHVEGAVDDRPLGMMFIELRLEPMRDE